MDSDVTVSALRSAWLVELSGEHDLATVPKLTEALNEIHAKGTDVVLDLTDAAFIDSSIVGVLAAHARRPGERMVVVAPAGSAAARVLELVRLDTVLCIVGTREQALDAFDG